MMLLLIEIQARHNGKGLGVEYFYSRTFDYGLSSSLIHAIIMFRALVINLLYTRHRISPFIQIKPIKVSSLRIGFNNSFLFITKTIYTRTTGLLKQ